MRTNNKALAVKARSGKKALSVKTVPYGSRRAPAKAANATTRRASRAPQVTGAYQASVFLVFRLSGATSDVAVRADDSTSQANLQYQVALQLSSIPDALRDLKPQPQSSTTEPQLSDCRNWAQSYLPTGWSLGTNADDTVVDHCFTNGGWTDCNSSPGNPEPFDSYAFRVYRGPAYYAQYPSVGNASLMLDCWVQVQPAGM
jgi:hypothetical protein